jgi:hypothetical protein
MGKLRYTGLAPELYIASAFTKVGILKASAAPTMGRAREI